MKNKITTVGDAIKKFENMIAYMKENYDENQEFRIEVDDNHGGSYTMKLSDIQVCEGDKEIVWLNVGL